MSLWIKLSVNLPEHPKMIELRVMAGAKADSAELGWYRILMAAKRYGRWTFASEDHLRHVAGRYFGFVPMYRLVGLLDDLTVHDGDVFNSPRTDTTNADRQRRFRERKRDVTPSNAADADVTYRPRAEQRREEQSRDAVTLSEMDRDGKDRYHELTLSRPWGRKSGEWIDRLENEFGRAAVLEGFDAVATQPTTSLLGRLEAWLGKRKEAEAKAAEERAAERERAAIAATKVTPEQAERQRQFIAAQIARKTA